MSQITEAATQQSGYTNAGQSFGRSSYSHYRSTNNNNMSNNVSHGSQSQQNREISVVISSNRRVENDRSYPTQLGGPVARMEIDNHADTHVAGSNCTVLYYTGRVCNVAPFTEHYHR
jgi:hypothetical protein